MKRALLLVLSLLLSVCCGCRRGAEEIDEKNYQSESGYRRTTLYYATEDGLVVPVTKSIPWEEGIGKAALGYLVSGEANDRSAAMMGLKTVIPEGTEYTLRINDDGEARVDLSGLGNQTDKEEQVMVTAIVNTLTEFPAIDSVKITLEGRERKSLPNGSDVSKPMQSTALNVEDGAVQVSGNAQRLTLYFPNASASLNVPVTRYTDTQPSFSSAVQQEIAGPKTSGLINCFPEGTELISAYIKDGIATVDLSREFEAVSETEGMLEAARDCMYLCAAQFEEVGGLDITVEGREYSMHTAAASAPAYINEWR